MDLALDFDIDKDEPPPLVSCEVDKGGDVIPHFVPHKYNEDFDHDDALYMMSDLMSLDTVEEQHAETHASLDADNSWPYSSLVFPPPTHYFK